MNQTAIITSCAAATTWTASPSSSSGTPPFNQGKPWTHRAFGALAVVAVTLCTGNVFAQSRGTVQYYTNTLAASPTNFFGSNVLAGTNIHLVRGAQGQLTINSTDTTGSGTNVLYQTNGVDVGTVGTLNIITGTNVAILATNNSGVVDVILHSTAIGGGGGEANVNGEISVTNATRFGWVYGKAGVTNLLRSISPGYSLAGTNEGTNVSLAVLPIWQIGSAILTNLTGTGALTNATAFQPASTTLSNLAGTGALTNATAFQPAHVILSNAVGTGILTNYALAGGGTSIVHSVSGGLITFNTLHALGGLVLHTNDNLLVLSNSVSAGSGTNTLWQTNGVDVADAGTLNLITGTNVAILATNNSGVIDVMIHAPVVQGETNYNGDAGVTNTSRYSLISGKIDNTNFLKTIMLGQGSITAQGSTNLVITPSISIGHAGGGTRLTANGASSSFTFNTLAADGGLVLHSNANLLTFSNSFLAQPASTTLSNLAGTGALTNATAFQPAHVILSNAVGTGVLTNYANAGDGTSIVHSVSGGVITFNTLHADGGLVLHTNDNLLVISNAVEAGPGGSLPDQETLYSGFPLRTDGADAFWGGPFFSSYMWEDFHTGTNLVGRVGLYHWNVVQAGNGTFDHRPSSFGRPHVLIIRTDGTSSDITHVSDFNRSHWFGRGEAMFSTSINMSHVPSTDFAQAFESRFGFIDVHTGDAINGIYFKASTNSAAWQCITVTNGVGLTNIAISNIYSGWVNLTAKINADATTATFYVGSSGTNLYPVATNTGYIPRFEHQACQPGMHIMKKLGSDRKTNAIDYFYFHEKLTTPR